MARRFVGCSTHAYAMYSERSFGAVAPRTAPWGTHAYVVDAETAERLALLGTHMMDRARLHAARRASAWQLDGHDIKIDHFIKNYYDSLLPQRLRSR